MTYGYGFTAYVKLMTKAILLMLCLLFQPSNRHEARKTANIYEKSAINTIKLR